MLRPLQSLRRALLLAAGLLFPLPGVAQTYTLGVVPQFEQRRLQAIWKPVVDEISRRSGLALQLEATLSVPEFEAALEQGRFDFVYANPYHILRVSDGQGYVPLVRDREPLRGILVVRRDSPIHSLQELDGRTLAVPSPNALGASLLVRADLERDHGVRPILLNVRTHSSAYLHVLNGLADAAGGVQKTLAEQSPEIREQLRVLYTTREMPSHPIAAHPRVPDEAREKLRRAVLALAATSAGQALLAEIPMPAPQATSLGDYTAMRQWGLERYWISGNR